MKPICVGCQRFYRPKKTGLYFIEGQPEDGARPGTVDADLWRPYKLYAGDKWKCQGCGAEIIVGVPHNAIAEHYEDQFESIRARLGATFQVNDC